MSDIKLKTSLKLSQQLKFSPQLQQSIKLLQLSRIDLEKEILRELNENPILEEQDIDFDEKELKEQINEISELEKKKELNENGEEPLGNQNNLDGFDWDDYFENQKQSQKMKNQGEIKDVIHYESFVAKAQSLYDHLKWQLSCSFFNVDEEKVAEVLIESINEDGYLTVPLEEIAKDHKWELDLVEEVLELIQDFDPIGVGARDLKECLLIQCNQYAKDKEDLSLIIKNHLKDLENKNFSAISKSMDLNLEAVHELYKIIKNLDPNPGRVFCNTQTSYITPDVYIKKIQGEYLIILNDEGLPRLKVSEQYRKLSLEGHDDKNTKNYVKGKLKNALWFIKSIHQRQRTIYKVVKSILKFQKPFFEQGPEMMKAMILKDVALDIGMHESTVSRVTSNKFVHTEHGIFELKYFFNSHVSQSQGQDSSQSVRAKIKKIISQEDSKQPFSDQQVAEILKNTGIKIARRTVAKYREALGILPSSKRKSI